MTESMNMLEKCARALQRRDFWDDDEADRVWNESLEDDDYKEAYRNSARAVLNTLKEPDEGMWMAADAASMAADGHEDEQGDFPSNRVAHLVIGYRTMITHILKESESNG